MSIIQENERHFEDFLPDNGRQDIFDKLEALDVHIRQSASAYVDGLSVQLLGAVANRTTVRDRNGESREVIMLGSNSYLSLTTHPRVVAACRDACAKYGYGMGAVSLYAGTTDLHRELEQLVAEFYGAEDAILIPCGYSANVGVISALCGAGDVVINDAYNHASIFDGCALSQAEVKVYLHRNLRHLEKILGQLPESQRGRLIVTDGVFSMDGDIAPLADIAALARRYGARVMVDDAHGLGVVGPTGRGTAEQCGCADQVDITVGTFSKTPGAIGGYCVGSARLIQYLRYYARTYFFSTSIPAPIVAGLIEVFKLLRDDAAGRDRLWHNIRYMKEGLMARGFDTGSSESAIIPVIVGDEAKLVQFNNDLRRNGVYTNIVTYPAVRRKECRLRLCIMNSLTQQDMDTALDTICRLGRDIGVIA
ncbi:MAG: aminotransferase class I/II-fold pyridoxal phosphate-dependent enzyme [bacterium]|nr:aminotransferase class I/II-fold pyridoxal phosphate-dependent enzyme [bacterium]